MNRKLLLKYIIIYTPFISGLILVGNGVLNLFSSVLCFVGGYIAIKNTIDYRLVKRNIRDSVIDNNLKKENADVNYTPVISKKKRNIRVRKRIK